MSFTPPLRATYQVDDLSVEYFGHWRVKRADFVSHALKAAAAASGMWDTVTDLYTFCLSLWKCVEFKISFKKPPKRVNEIKPKIADLHNLVCCSVCSHSVSPSASLPLLEVVAATTAAATTKLRRLPILWDDWLCKNKICVFSKFFDRAQGRHKESYVDAVYGSSRCPTN